MSIIQVENLSKRFRVARKQPGLAGAFRALIRPAYEEKTAVGGISFAVAPGEIVGYIGVNGAGKSTTIKMLTGILLPTGGQVRVMGRDPYRQRVANARAIGVVFGQRSQLWWDLALIESLDLLARIYELPPARYRERLALFSDLLDLGDLLRKPVRTMSLGQKMRAELAAALLHDPRIVYLDEPTIGLDLVVKERIRAFIRQVNRESGTTVLLTTHDLGDIEDLCRRVLIIDSGSLLYDGPLQAIQERFGQHRLLTCETTGAVGTLALPEGAELVEAAERRLVVRFERSRLTASQVAQAIMTQVDLVDFQLREPDLASVIRQIYGGALASRRPDREGAAL